jgi:hypothetical protein
MGIGSITLACWQNDLTRTAKDIQHAKDARLNLIREIRESIMDDPFTGAYVVAALWSSSDDTGTPLDTCYLPHDIALKSLMKMAEDCYNFCVQNSKDLAGLDEEQCGHDFWLTRNGHGAGFWDRGYGERGDRLTEACKKFGEKDLYVGDDGVLYTD